MGMICMILFGSFWVRFYRGHFNTLKILYLLVWSKNLHSEELFINRDTANSRTLWVNCTAAPCHLPRTYCAAEFS